MNVWFIGIKFIAVSILFFANLFSINAQTETSIYQLPAGTTLLVRMDNEISSKVSGTGDTFTMTLAAPVVRGETMVLPVGTVIEGRVTKVKRAAFGGKNGDLTLSFRTLRLSERVKREIEGVLINSLKPESATTVNALTILGGAAVGGIIGAVSKAEAGTLIGAGIGAGAGASFAFLKKGSDVGIKADQQFEIKLTKSVNLTVTDF